MFLINFPNSRSELPRTLYDSLLPNTLHIFSFPFSFFILDTLEFGIIIFLKKMSVFVVFTSVVGEGECKKAEVFKNVPRGGKVFLLLF